MNSSEIFDHLLRLGEARGILHVDDIHRIVPVDSLSTGELADLILRLEEAGVAIEVDQVLLVRRGGTGERNLRGLNGSLNLPAPPHRMSSHHRGIDLPRETAPPASAPPSSTGPRLTGMQMLAAISGVLILSLLVLLMWRAW